MDSLIFRIMSSDRTISGRWQKAFQKEGWVVAIGAAWAPGEQNRGGRAELDLIEAGVPGCMNQEDLKAILKTRHPVSALVFGEAQKISNTQIAAFLESGADDFVYKTLDERVLVAKLKAHMRRIMPAITEAAARLESCNGDLEIDRNSRAVRIASGSGKCTEFSNLTQKEFEILTILVGQERRVVTRESMLEKLWGDGATEVYSECIDKHIESLRRKLGIHGKRIKTVYGSGYMFTGGNNPTR